MSSILTNNGAIVALQTLKGINQNLGKTQDSISTGKMINNAKDNAAIWAISKVMDSDVSAFKSIQSNLSMGASVITNGRVAAETVGDLLNQIKTKVVAAQDGSFNRETLQADIDDLKAQITSAVSASQFNGINLVNGSETVDFEVLASLDRAADGTMTPSTIDVDPTATDLSLGGTILAAMDAIDVTTSADLGADLQTVEDAVADVIDVAFAFGSAGKRIEIQSNFISKLSDSMTTAIGALVDTNMEEASARLQALQTQQQLGIQSLSIANQAPQSILALFRG
ncbi:flagellin [Paracoccus tegillarcae]|uniref:Flagellin n=1 Tax=Paracoccus tegillarcae TaxID=1529068 RepID=A0A2K9EGD0_9RHOB|nr:flagellin [Paracoccus tegillarcae]AUH33399.1 flagellin [Paracoccus tegillarcae]